MCDGLVPSPVVINEPEMTKCFLHVHPHKIPGPDGGRGVGGVCTRVCVLVCQ